MNFTPALLYNYLFGMFVNFNVMKFSLKFDILLSKIWKFFHQPDKVLKMIQTNLIEQNLSWMGFS